MLTFKPHSRASQVAFSPDGASIATCGNRPDLCVSDAATGKVRWKADSTPVALSGRGLAYSPDGTKIATRMRMCDESYVYDAATGELLHRAAGSEWAITFTPDGTGVVTGTAVYAIGHLSRTDLATGHVWPVSGIRQSNYFSRVRYSPDGRTFAALGQSGLQLVNADSGEVVGGRHLSNLVEGVGVLAFHPAAGTVVYSDGPKLIEYDFTANRIVAEWKRSTKHFQDGAFTPDGKFFLTVSNDATAVVWETGGWTEVRAFAWDIGPLKSVAVAPDGMRAVCASDRGRIVVWDLDL